VRDFEYLTEYWNEQGHSSATDTAGYIEWLGNELRDKCGLEISNIDSSGSEFFKMVYSNSARIIRRK
jgi:hypothetical protein